MQPWKITAPSGDIAAKPTHIQYGEGDISNQQVGGEDMDMAWVSRV